MATKVNTKFVVGLLAVMLITVGGVVFLAMRAFTASGDRQFAQGEAAMLRYQQSLAANNEPAAREAIREAASSFERAVGREPTRLDWLEKWQEALLLVTPNSPSDADRQHRWYRQIPRSMAMLRPEEPSYALPFFERLWAELEGTTSVQGPEFVISEVDTLARRYPTSLPDTHRVLAYKGKAVVRLMGVTPVEEQRRSEARQILESAVAALPDDPTPRMWLARWHLAEAQSHREARRTESSQSEFDRAAQIVGESLAAFPDAVEPQMLAFEVARQRATRDGQTATLNDVATPIVREIVATMRRLPVESLDLLQMSDVSLFTQALGLTEEFNATVSMLKAHAESEGASPRAWLVLSQVFERRNDYTGQSDAAGRVLTLPDPTVGRDSQAMPRYRLIASQLQLDAALSQWELASTPEDRATFERLATERLEQFAARVPATESFLLSDRRGRMALLRGSPAEALAPLSEAVRGYEGAGRPIPLPVLRSLAVALEQTNNPGEAKRTWRQVLSRAQQNGGDDPRARLRIGSISADLREYDTALAELQTAADLLGPGNNALALFAIGRFYELLLERNETPTLPGKGRVTEEQLIAEATAALQKVREISPDNEQVNAALSRLAARSGQGGDMELLAWMNAQRSAEAGDFQAADRVLEEAIAAGHGSARLWLLRTDYLSRTGQPERAAEIIEQAALQYPENANIQRNLRLVRSADPMETALAEIADPFQRAMARFQISASRNDEPGMDAALDEARAIDPDHNNIIDIDFERAIQRREWDRAGALARRAGERNADQLGGLLFQGRLHYAQGNFAEAVRTLRQAVQQMEFNPNAWRWLGLSQMRTGQTNEAVESLSRAMQGRPSDHLIARDYANALVRAGRGAEALAAIDDQTGVLKFGQRTPDMVELWLDLAVRFGGPEGRQTALRERRAMHQREPGNAVNAASLAIALFDADEWDEAGAIIDRLRNDPNANPVAVAVLHARWLHRQGRVEEAAGSFESFLATRPEFRDSAGGQLILGDLLLEFGMPDRAIEKLLLADELSKPGQTDAARRIADLYFSASVQGQQTAEQAAARGMNEQAALLRQQAGIYAGQSVDYFGRVLASLDPQTNADEHAMIGLRIVEAQVRLDRLSDAEQSLASLGSLAQNDLRRSIYRGRIASARGETRQARQIMDEAVRDHPNDASAFLNRAMINSTDATLISDVLADLDRAGELQPNNIEAWRLRVELLRGRGEINSAVASLRSAIQLNPNQDNLRNYLIDTLINSGRMAEGADEAVRLADENPRNTEVQIRTIQLMQQVGRWNDASRLLTRLREAEPNNPFYAASWLEAQLNAGTRPTPAQANPVLRVIRSAAAYGTPSEAITWATTEARATHALSQAAQQARDEGLARRYAEESRNALTRGIRLVGENPAAASVWFNAAAAVLGSGDEALRFARTARGDNPLPPMLLAIEQNIRMLSSSGDESVMLGVIETTDSLLAELGDTPAIRLELLKTRGLAATQIGAHAKAAESYEGILQLNPNDPVSLNNLAYLMATELKQPERGLGYAERALAIAPENATVLDTLGAIYLSFDPPRYAEAEQVLRRAVAFARTPDEQFPSNIHLAQSLIGQGMMPQARSAAEAARRAMSGADSTLRRVYTAQLEEIEEALRR